jgi:hypothetical protein
VLLCCCTIALWIFQVGCGPESRDFGDEDDDGSGDSDSDSDSDSDGDSDSDSDVDCDGIPWGSGWVIGNPVHNLNITGYADENGDHQVEQNETTFSFEDMACKGHQSVLIVWSDWCST